MDIKKQFALYEKTVKRLERAGISNPIGQIIYLADEIEVYRGKIRGLEEHIKDLAKITESETMRPTWAAHEKPYIELRPTCSECGAVLEKIDLDYIAKQSKAFEFFEIQVTPSECPYCGAIFGHIAFQGELPTEGDE